MATVHLDEKTGVFQFHYRLFERQFKRSLGVKNEKEANDLAARYKRTIGDIKSCLLNPSEDVRNNPDNLWAYIKSHGQQVKAPVMAEVLTLEGLFERYFANVPPGKEENTLATERTHRKHLTRLLGKRKAVGSITRTDLQAYVNGRIKERDGIRRQTIDKELHTLSAIWNRHQDVIGAPYPRVSPALDFPKGKEKLPFQEWKQIERCIAARKMTPDEIKEQWDSLFLNTDEIEECLNYIQQKTLSSKSAYFYPLMVVVAHTGARRKEIERAKREDFRFDENAVIIREKKRDSSKTTFRRVNMTPRIREAMLAY